MTIPSSRSEESTADLAMISIFIFLVALSLRLAYLYQVKDDILTRILIVDPEYYDAWAKRIAAGQWVQKDVFWLDPLFAYLLAAIYKLFGPSHSLARVIQAIVDSYSCLLLLNIGRALWNRSAGILAASIYAACGVAVYYTNLLDKTTFTIFFVCTGLYLLIDACKANSPRRFFVSGLVFGLTSLIRGNILIVSAIVTAWLIFFHRRGMPQFPRIKRAGCFLLGTVMMAGLATLHNWIITKSLIPITADSGWVFYLSNRSETSGTMPGPGLGCTTSECEYSSARFLAEKITGKPLNGPEKISPFWFNEAMGRIRADTRGWLRLVGQKLILAASDFEAADSYGIYYFHDRSSILRSLPVTYGLILAFGVLGIILCLSASESALIPLIFFCGYLGTLLLFTVTSRYRFPLVIPLTLFAGYSLEKIYRLTIQRSWGRLGLCLAFTIILATISRAQPLFLQRLAASTRIVPYMNAALIYKDHGEPKRALELVDQVLRFGPNSDWAWEVKGEILYSTGRMDEAYSAFLASIRINPKQDEALNYLGALCVKKGDNEAAARYFKAAAAASTIPEKSEMFLANYRDILLFIEGSSNSADTQTVSRFSRN